MKELQKLLKLLKNNNLLSVELIFVKYIKNSEELISRSFFIILITF